MKTKGQRNRLEEVRERLLRLARGRNTAQKVVLRANIILKMMEGLQKKRIAEQLGTTRPTVYLWIKRHEEEGIEGLQRDASRSGRKPTLTEEKERNCGEHTARQTSQCHTLEYSFYGKGKGSNALDGS